VKQRNTPATAVERVAKYVEHRTGMGGLDPDEINTVCRHDEFTTLSLNDLRELVAQARELATLKSQTVIFWQGDWAARVDAEGNLIDQGHHDAVRERVVDELMGETYPSGPLPFDRRIPAETNLAEFL
jgi:hypothetical protein